jgi:VWFA-related protein
MTSLNLFQKLKFLAVLLFCLSAVSVHAQQTPQQETAARQADEDETIRINTELIQTGVSVFDKQGRFVDKLKPEDFVLRVDGKQLPVSFFERVTSRNNPAQPVEGNNPVSTEANVAPSSGRGRIIIFYVDDTHLSFENHKRSRDMILRFIEREMEQDDSVAIISSSGKVGFLQQFTDNKIVLRAAVERIRYNKDTVAIDREEPRMTEYHALQIDRYDPEVTANFVAAYMAKWGVQNRESALMHVRSRARSVLQQAAIVSRNTYATLEQTLRKSTQFTGRKIVFFVSDGFFLDTSNTDSSTRLNRIADAASRANAVIYSFDAKGLDAEWSDGVKAGERWEQQDPLNKLADSTGGRFTRNTNDLNSGVTKALAEASVYYLLAWRPDPEKRGQDKLRRIEVSVRGRPDLSVRVQSGYLDNAQKPESDKKQATQPAATAADTQLQRAFTAIVPRRDLPTALSVNYINSLTEGPTTTIALRIKGEAVEFAPSADNHAAANIDLVGAIFNAQGKREDFFRKRLTVNANASSLESKDERSDLFYNYQARLKPGLYQIRIAARDAKSGLLGSATEWVEIPDLNKNRLALSSLLIGEKTTDARQQKVGLTVAIDSIGVTLSVDRSFARNSRLRYLLFIYNASTKAGNNLPDISIQTEVFRDKRSVLASPDSRVSVMGQDAARLPYAAEIPLETLTAGRYILQVTVTDRAAKTSAQQQVRFEIK